MSSLTVVAEDIAITGGTIHTMGPQGKIENGTVLISDGKIVRVLAEKSVPDGYREIDASYSIITPGLMVSSSSLGLVEVSSSAGLNESRYSEKEKVKLDLDISKALNPDVTLIPVTRIEGITRAVTSFSTAAPFGFGGAVIHLNGDDMLSKAHSYVLLNVTDSAAREQGKGRVALWQAIEDKLDAAATPPEKDKDGKAKEGKPDADKDVLKKVLSGDIALGVYTNRKADIRQVIAMKEKYAIPHVILMGAAEAWRVADELAESDISVVVSGKSNLPGGFETIGSTQASAARLAQAGVTIAFTGDGSHNARLMPQHAGNAVAQGLDWDIAMQAMTINPAKMFGIADSYGSLQSGKDADVVVWSGNPIELSSSPTAVIIRGEQVPLESRQTKLAERYLELSPHPQFKR